jgi:hypothetical protein
VPGPAGTVSGMSPWWLLLIVPGAIVAGLGVGLMVVLWPWIRNNPFGR